MAVRSRSGCGPVRAGQAAAAGGPEQVLRCKIVLVRAEDATSTQVAGRLRVSMPTVGKCSAGKVSLTDPILEDGTAVKVSDPPAVSISHFVQPECLPGQVLGEPPCRAHNTDR